jgi:hypothetical protein
MSLQIQTDLDVLLPETLLGSLTDEVRAAMALDIATELQSRWRTLAKERLKTALSDYENGIQEAHLEGQAAVVALVGDLPNRLEHGSPAYDMRSTLLGPNVPIVPARSGQRGKHQSKNGGYFRSIPFRHQTPSKGGFDVQSMRHAKTMGAAYRGMMGDGEAEKLGKAIYAVAKTLGGSTSAPYKLTGQKTTTKTPSGKQTRLATMGPPKYANRLPSGLAPKLRPHHSTDIYAGMVKAQATYKKSTQSSYMTFRTISTNKTVGWQSPARPGVQIMAELQKEVASIAEGVLQNFMRRGMGK